MIELPSRLEGKQFQLYHLEEQLKPLGYVIGGGWDDDGYYHYCGHECHLGIFWGDTPSDDVFLHCAAPHCTQTRITPACWGSTYHLIKFD